jgi:hypothetical protein
VADEKPKLVHPGITSEIPDIETENIYEKEIGPSPMAETIKPPSYAERIVNTHLNAAGLDADKQTQGVDKKQNKVLHHG